MDFICRRLLFPKGTQWVCVEVNKIGAGFQGVSGSKMRNADRVRTDANDLAIFRPGEPAIHLRRPLICWWWILNCPADEGSRGGVLVVVAAALVSVSASSLPRFPLCPSTHRRVFGPGRAWKNNLR